MALTLLAEGLSNRTFFFGHAQILRVTLKTSCGALITTLAVSCRTSQSFSFSSKNRQKAGSQIQSSLFDLSRHLPMRRKCREVGTGNWERLLLLTAMFPNSGLLNRLNYTLNQTKPISIRSSKQFRKRASRGKGHRTMVQRQFLQRVRIARNAERCTS